MVTQMGGRGPGIEGRTSGGGGRVCFYKRYFCIVRRCRGWRTDAQYEWRSHIISFSFKYLPMNLMFISTGWSPTLFLGSILPSNSIVEIREFLCHEIGTVWGISNINPIQILEGCGPLKDYGV